VLFCTQIGRGSLLLYRELPLSVLQLVLLARRDRTDSGDPIEFDLDDLSRTITTAYRTVE
jgi:hypothetical protein